MTLANTRAAVGASHGLKLISAPRRITASKGNDLHSIANLHALQTLYSACKKHEIAAEDLPYHQLIAVHASKASALERGEYNLASMPNIKLGNDVNYALGSIYQLRTFPSIFVYDNSGKLAKAFVGNADVPTILAALK